MGAAGVWAWLGWGYAPLLIPMSVLVLSYSLAHDWHEDAAAYRTVLDDIAALDARRR